MLCLASTVPIILNCFACHQVGKAVHVVGKEV